MQQVHECKKEAISSGKYQQTGEIQFASYRIDGVGWGGHDESLRYLRDHTRTTMDLAIVGMIAFRLLKTSMYSSN